MDVREESQLDDMRSAIRGDFERLERRRGAQELMRPRTAADERDAEGTVPTTAREDAPRSWVARLLAR